MVDNREITIRLNEHAKLVLEVPSELNALQAQGTFRLIGEVARKFANGNSNEINIITQRKGGMSVEKQKKLIELYTAKTPILQIANEFGMTKGAVSGKVYALKEKGLIPKSINLRNRRN